VIGVDYPFPIVDHDVVSKENMAKMKEAYQNGKKGEIQENAFFGPLAAPFVKSKKRGLEADSLKASKKKK
jgi:hypothetical protein